MKIIREKVMKRRLGTIAALLLCVILTTVNIWADDGKGQDPDMSLIIIWSCRVLRVA